MNNEERKYRFSELMTAIHLLDEEENNPILPNGTAGLSDGQLKSAIMCQTFKEKEEFQVRLVNALANTAMEPCGRGDKPSHEDMCALSMAIHICWAIGALPQLMTLLGFASKISDVFEVDIPDDVELIFRPNAHATKFGDLDPYVILDGDMDKVIEMLSDNLNMDKVVSMLNHLKGE